MRVAIVGGGVIGLTVAHRLIQLAEEITLFSPQPLGEITSSVAAAYWSPYWVGNYDRSIAVETLIELQSLAEKRVPGVSLMRFEQWFTEDATESFEAKREVSHWWSELPGIDFKIEPVASPMSRNISGKTIRFTQKATFHSVVARMPDYLRWLEDALLDNDHFLLARQWVDDLTLLSNQFDAVIHCSGWGAKTLAANDEATAKMKLLAGHIVTVNAPNVTSGVLFCGQPFDVDPVYIVPRHGTTSDVLLGGTAIEIEETLDPRKPITFQRDEVCEQVHQRALQSVPALGNSSEISRGVGIRPVRDAVRIEQDHANAKLIHCYGHGGSGLTLSWGSANRVADLLVSSP